MERELKLRIVLEKPPPGVDLGLQQGSGNDYQTIQKQRSKGRDVAFDCHVTVRDNRADGLPNFLGPLTQGPPTARFIYIDVGQYAGQKNTGCARRIKVPLSAITWKMIEQANTLEARLPGTGKDGGPVCGTVRPAHGWKLIRG